MPPTIASTRLGLFALLLSAVVLSLIGSLIAADHAVVNAAQESVELDARSVALVAERELRLAAAALAPQGSIDDSIGVRALPGGDILVTAFFTQRGRPGTVATRIPGARLLATLHSDTAARHWLALRTADRELATLGTHDSSDADLYAVSPIRLPGDSFSVAVAHPQTGRTLRTTLWILGAVALVLLLAGLTRERRQAIQLTARTTELERLYQEVARSNRMKSEFLANVSHELRTPLNAIVGFVEMLREGVYGSLTPRQEAPVDRIAASATHLRHLVDRLLDIAKIAAGRLEVHPEPLVLRPFILDVASEMESLVNESGLTLSIAVGGSVPRIRTDQTHLRQILINLIGNAVKYTPSGSIEVRVAVLGDGVTPSTAEPGLDVRQMPDRGRGWVALQVIDTGMGIAPGDLGRIFDEFEQVNAGARTDSARRGTGLGLAISRRLARLIGGELTVVSVPQRGSTFTVWLPLEGAAGS